MGSLSSLLTNINHPKLDIHTSLPECFDIATTILKEKQMASKAETPGLPMRGCMEFQIMGPLGMRAFRCRFTNQAR